MNDRMHGYMNDCLADCLRAGMDRWRNEWIHKHMNKSMHERGNRAGRRRIQSATVWPLNYWATHSVPSIRLSLQKMLYDLACPQTLHLTVPLFVSWNCDEQEGSRGQRRKAVRLQRLQLTLVTFSGWSATQRSGGNQQGEDVCCSASH